MSLFSLTTVPDAPLGVWFSDIFFFTKNDEPVFQMEINKLPKIKNVFIVKWKVTHCDIESVWRIEKQKFATSRLSIREILNTIRYNLYRTSFFIIWTSHFEVILSRVRENWTRCKFGTKATIKLVYIIASVRQVSLHYISVLQSVFLFWYLGFNWDTIPVQINKIVRNDILSSKYEHLKVLDHSIKYL